MEKHTRWMGYKTFGRESQVESFPELRLDDSFKSSIEICPKQLSAKWALKPPNKRHKQWITEDRQRLERRARAHRWTKEPSQGLGENRPKK